REVLKSGPDDRISVGGGTRMSRARCEWAESFERVRRGADADAGTFSRTEDLWQSPTGDVKPRVSLQAGVSLRPLHLESSTAGRASKKRRGAIAGAQSSELIRQLLFARKFLKAADRLPPG